MRNWASPRSRHCASRWRAAFRWGSSRNGSWQTSFASSGGRREEGRTMPTLKGALIAFTPGFIGATPQVIVFQINPETIAHRWEAKAAGGSDPGDEGMRTYYD